MIINTKDVMEKFLEYLRKICPLISSSSPGKERDDKAAKIAQEAQKDIKDFCAFDPLLMSGIIPELEAGQKFYYPLFGIAYVFAKMARNTVPCKPELVKALDAIASFLEFQDKELEGARFIANSSPNCPGQIQNFVTDEAKDAMFKFTIKMEIFDQARLKEHENTGISALDLVLLVLENQPQ